MKPGTVLEELDLLGRRCPIPIVQVMKTVVKLDIGDLVAARADDPAFEADVVAWCRRTGNELVSLERVNGAIEAVVKKSVD